MPVQLALADKLKAALDATLREHVTVINTGFGKPFTVNGFSGILLQWISANCCGTGPDAR